MKSDHIFSLAAILLSIFATDTRGATADERSISPSGQFVLYGADASTRGLVSDLAERTKKNLLALLRRHDEWKIPVVINLRPRAVNLPELGMSELEFARTESGLRLQLDLTIGSQINGDVIERELERVVVLEMMYRNRGKVAFGVAYVEPPNWLIEGLLACEPNRDRASVVAALDATGGVTSLDEFLHQRAETLGSAGKELYRAYSCGLLQLLIEHGEGALRLGRYIDNLALASNDPLADLRAAFPNLRDWDKLWQAEIVSLKLSGREGLLSFGQSDSKLNEILRTTFPPLEGSKRSMSLEQLPRVALDAEQRQALQEFSHRLLMLANHANPVLRPIVERYQRIADELALRQNRRAASRLAELKSLHEKVSARMSEIDDYMNWFEATKLETPSGLFEREASTAGEIGAGKRKDALSVYLDAMELEF